MNRSRQCSNRYLKIASQICERLTTALEEMDALSVPGREGDAPAEPFLSVPGREGDAPAEPFRFSTPHSRTVRQEPHPPETWEVFTVTLQGECSNGFSPGEMLSLTETISVTGDGGPVFGKVIRGRSSLENPAMNCRRSQPVTARTCCTSRAGMPHCAQRREGFYAEKDRRFTPVRKARP